MSERVYEDGTPAAYEPKVEPWMIRAAEDLCPISEATPLYIRVEIQDRQDDVAAIIAKHAAEPQPIRRGDVVQCIRDCDADVGTGVMVVKELAVVDEVSSDGRLILFGRLFDPEAFVRIGHAKLMPDGTPVED